MSDIILDRIKGCLKGLAVGDAIGKQTETLEFDQIKSWYPYGIKGFEGKIGTIMPRYINRHYDWKFGETTDDTEQSLAVAKAIVENNEITHGIVGQKLMLCKKSNRPTLQLGKFQQIGDSERVSYDGDGCGAAMRVAPIGIIYSSGRLNEVVNSVFESCIPTHGGQLAICAAAAIAGAVAAAIDGKCEDDILQAALSGSIEAEKYRSPLGSTKFDEVLYSMYEDLVRKEELDLNYLKEKYFPRTTVNIVPLSIVLALITKSAEKATLIAANIGGDSDSVASMSSAIAGAMAPKTVNAEWYKCVKSVNGDELTEMADKLYSLRK